ncbi:hypothetical protein ACS0TY_035016 [Phlomoides rotata]
MDQSDFDSITTKVRHLRENIAELQMNYDQLTLNAKVSGNVQQANLDIIQTSIHGVRYAQRLLWQALECPLIRTGSLSMTQKEKRPDHRASTYIKTQKTKPVLVVNLTEDEVSTRRAWGVWVYLTEMDKVEYPFKIYQNSVNGSFLLNTMMGNTTRFANDMFKQKRAMIWENKLIGTENTR